MRDCGHCCHYGNMQRTVRTELGFMVQKLYSVYVLKSKLHFLPHFLQVNSKWFFNQTCVQYVAKIKQW